MDDALGLVEQVGVPVPDGDTVKVDTAAHAWDRLATVYQTTTVVEALDVNARAFSDTRSPEVEYLTSDLRELRDATSAILAGCGELAQSCRDYKAALDDLRQQLEDILTDLAIELAATAVISIFAACVSFGVGAAAGTAKAAHTITKFADTIRSAIRSVEDLQTHQPRRQESPRHRRHPQTARTHQKPRAQGQRVGPVSGSRGSQETLKPSGSTRESVVDNA